MDSFPEVSLLIEGQEFTARRDVLCEHSDYFRAMFSGNYVEHDQQEISIDVVDANSMNILLRYMELGLIDLSEYSLAAIGELAVSANFLQITELVKQIEYSLEFSLNLSDWVEIMVIAENASFSKLEQYAAAYGLYAFKNMEPQYIPNIQKLYWYLSHPYLDTSSELKVFKFGIKWIVHHEAGGDALLILLGCLDMNRLKSVEIKEMKDLINDYVNSLAEKVIDCLYRLSTDFSITVDAITENKQKLCEMFTERVYSEVLHLVKDSIRRNLDYVPAVPLWTLQGSKPEAVPHFLYTFTKEKGFEKFLQVADTNIWGWNVVSWGPSHIVVVGGECGRGTGNFIQTVRIYNVFKKEWCEHGAFLPRRRHGGVAIVEDLLYIIGGVGGFRHYYMSSESRNVIESNRSGKWVVLDTAIIYDLKARTIRKIANLPDAIQSPAVCAHDNMIYASGHKHVYRYEDLGETDRWKTVAETDIRPNCMVSYNGYIYLTQSYFGNLYRFRPDIDVKLELVTTFSNPVATMCNLGNRLYAFTCASSDVMSVEQYDDSKTDIEELWSQTNLDFKVNDVAGACCVATSLPPVNSRKISQHLKRYLMSYDAYATRD